MLPALFDGFKVYIGIIILTNRHKNKNIVNYLFGLSDIILERIYENKLSTT